MGSDGYVEASIDRATVLRATSLEFGQGLAGLYVKGAPRSPAAKFDYRAPTGVKVNFYARLAEGPWREIGFTSPSPRSTAAPGTNPSASCQMEGIKADGEWHHAKFPFASLPGVEPSKPFLLSALAISSPSDPYLRCGIGGNPLGIAYHLDNFVLRVPE